MLWEHKPYASVCTAFLSCLAICLAYWHGTGLTSFGRFTTFRGGCRYFQDLLEANFFLMLLSGGIYYLNFTVAFLTDLLLKCRLE